MKIDTDWWIKSWGVNRTFVPEYRKQGTEYQTTNLEYLKYGLIYWTYKV